MIIYLSGRISGLTKKEYTANFLLAENKFKKGYVDYDFDFIDVINPLNIKPLFGIKNWWCYMAADLWQLRKCDTIALMQNWKDSKGACVEHFIGKFILKLKVIYL